MREGRSMAEEVEWFVGIDWASQSHQVCLIDAHGECLGERAVAHGGAGIEELCDWLIARTGATPEVIGVAMAQTASAPLALEAKIALGEVSGRIDHLSIDPKRQRLFVTELGNNSLGVVDLAAGKVLRRISGLSEPQGVAYVPFADSVYVANAGDGSVHVLRGDDLAPIGRIELGDDADNVRVDAQRSRVLVGYGKGALAVIDPASRTKAADIRLKGHPEGFQIDEAGTQVFVNVPDAREIEVVDLASEANRSLPTQGAGSNFPMAIDGESRRVLAVFRSPPTLMALSSQDGRVA